MRRCKANVTLQRNETNVNTNTNVRQIQIQMWDKYKYKCETNTQIWRLSICNMCMPILDNDFLWLPDENYWCWNAEMLSLTWMPLRFFYFYLFLFFIFLFYDLAAFESPCSALKKSLRQRYLQPNSSISS